MKIPKKFKYMGLEYTVSYASPVDTTRLTAWAITSHKNQTIIIDSTLSPQLQEQTFIHELLHIIFFNMGLDQLDKNDMEEAFVNAMANGLYALLKTGLLKDI